MYSPHLSQLKSHGSICAFLQRYLYRAYIIGTSIRFRQFPLFAERSDVMLPVTINFLGLLHSTPATYT
jgi:hypothetical protein